MAFLLCVWHLVECASHWISEGGCVDTVLGDAALWFGLGLAPCAVVSVYDMECRGSMLGPVQKSAQCRGSYIR